MRRATFALGLCLSATTFAQTTQPTSKPTTQPIDPAAVTALVTQLGADDAVDRDAARAKLAAMGLGVLPELQKAIADTPDPEVRTSLQQLTKEIAALDRSVPTLVTLKSKGTAKAAIEELSKQAGVPIGVWPDYVWHNVRGTVTIDAEKQPFWVVLLDVCNQAGLGTQAGHLGRGQIVLAQSGSPKAKPSPQYFRDGMLFAVRSINRQHNISYDNGVQKSDSFSLSLQAFVDPRIQVIRGPSGVKVTEALDDKGNSLIAPGGQADTQSSPWGATWSWELSAPLKYNRDQGSVLKSFKGTAPFDVVDGVDEWEVDLAKFERSERKFSRGTYTVESVNPQANGCTVKITMNVKEAGGLFGGRRMHDDPYTDMRSVQNLMKVTDDTGRVLSGQSGGGGGGGGKYSYDISFQDNNGGGFGKPVKLVWSIPKAIKRVDVPVEFTNLQIP